MAPTYRKGDTTNCCLHRPYRYNGQKHWDPNDKNRPHSCHRHKAHGCCYRPRYHRLTRSYTGNSGRRDSPAHQQDEGSDGSYFSDRKRAAGSKYLSFQKTAKKRKILTLGKVVQYERNVYKSVKSSVRQMG